MTSLDQKMFPNFVARERSQKRRSLNGCRQKGRFHNQKSTRSGKLSSQGRRNERTSLASNPLSGNILIFKECKGRLTAEAYCFAMHEATFDENTHNIMGHTSLPAIGRTLCRTRCWPRSTRFIRQRPTTSRSLIRSSSKNKSCFIKR